MGYSMKAAMLIFMVLLATNLVQASNTIPQVTQTELEMQLALINKPAVQSFQTKHGDVVDCVEIHKQLTFDNTLLKNHSIQLKPSNNEIIPRHRKPSPVLKISELLPKNMRCPKGTVAIKSVQKEDLLRMTDRSSFGMALMSSSSSKSVYPDMDQPEGHQVASIVMPVKNRGVHGDINAWAVSDVAAGQFSYAAIFVASDDGSNINGVTAGWSVNPQLYPNSTRLTTFWTKDGGKSTGCFNTLCPGFVQVSREITPGLVIRPLSTYGGPQYEIEVSIAQDKSSGNWWVYFGGKQVGYYPKELFTTLGDGAEKAGWGGEVASPTTQLAPGMGSGHFPEEGFGKAAYIKRMKMVDDSFAPLYPDNNRVKEEVSMPHCYKASCKGAALGDEGFFMFFGGPPGCLLLT